MAKSGFVSSAVVPTRGGCLADATCGLNVPPTKWVRSRMSPARRVRAPAFDLRRCPISAAADAMEVSSESFETEVLKSEVPVLVDFYAEWCGPCKLVSPLMSWAAAEYGDRLKVVKIDTEKSKDFVSKYGIHGLPTFAVFKDGEAFGVQEGALGKQGLQEYILKHIPELA